MTALPPEADIRQRIEHVCFVPIAEISFDDRCIARPGLDNTNLASNVLPPVLITFLDADKIRR
jgi:hypothetical protein